MCVFHTFMINMYLQLFGNNKRKFFWGMRLGMNDKVELSRRITMTGTVHFCPRNMLPFFFTSMILFLLGLKLTNTSLWMIEWENWKGYLPNLLERWFWGQIFVFQVRSMKFWLQLGFAKPVKMAGSDFTYSRVHKRWQSFFSKILEKPSIVQKKMLPHIKGLDFSQRWSKKNSKWPT